MERGTKKQTPANAKQDQDATITHFCHSSITLQPPAPFDFQSPEKWGKCSRRFDRYRMVSGLDQEPEEKQVTSLIYCMGEDADDILIRAQLSEEKRNSYKDVKAAFEEAFIGKRNTIYERAKFNSRSQKVGENFEQFLTEISLMAEHCEFQNLRDELLRDRIVVGIIDRELSAQLQEDSNLTLEKAIRKCKLREAITKQAADLHSTQGSSSQPLATVDNVDASQNQLCVNSKICTSSVPHQTSLKKIEPCWFCGGPRHPRFKCPARDHTCESCRKVGHRSEVCLSRNFLAPNESDINEDETQDKNVNIAYLSTLNAVGGDSNPWHVRIRVNNQPFTAKLDSGAEVTAFPAKSVRRNQPLSKSDRILMSADQREMKVIGMFQAEVSHKNSSTQEKIYVVDQLAEPLLGLPLLKSLNLMEVPSKQDTHTHNIQEIPWQKIEGIEREVQMLKNLFIKPTFMTDRAAISCRSTRTERAVPRRNFNSRKPVRSYSEVLRNRL